MYFYTLGNMLGVDRIHKWAVNLGLHGKSGIDLPNEQDSLVPSIEWKKQRTGERWYPGETISVAIGQGQNSVTPDGARGDDVDARQWRHPLHPSAGESGRRRQGVEGRAAAAQPVQAVAVQARHHTVRFTMACGWRSMAPAPRGARASTGRDVAGKTGTAQVISLQGRERARGSDKDLRDHGWFVFMVPRDNPELAGVVFAEHSEHGYFGGADRQAHHRDLLRGEGRPTAADVRESRRPARPPRRLRAPSPLATPHELRRQLAGGPAALASIVRCSNAASTSTSTGR